ncbi:DUF1376 domain-containing protein [Rhizobium ruizarguesonis]|uniref:DUF1376 domain-containing protein n=1 Tax=Rhizobium ruizarguesonis TaxID=2081791 RepID=UPI001030C845|nr:DUF1376 domain-containing protein [Rhizobium ruizarguesonis]TBD41632.1 DUF1376 domain-containing protein [Rhizobium ruizarguesonis]
MTNLPLPWMQIYVADEFADTSHLSPGEYGAHMRLRLHQWRHGELPPDDERLARIVGVDREQWPPIRDALAPMFDWQWHHAKTAELRRQSEMLRQAKVENGKKGGRPPKSEEKLTETETKPMGKANQNPNESSSPSPSPSQLPPASRSALPAQGLALDKREDEDRGSMFRAFAVPSSAAKAREFLDSKKVPQSRMDECIRLMMGGNLSPYELEGILSEGKSVA